MTTTAMTNSPKTMTILAEVASTLCSSIGMALRYLWLPIVVYGGILSLFRHTDVVFMVEGIGTFISSITFFVFQAIFTVTWLRYIMLGKDGLKGRGILTFRAAEGLTFGWHFALLLWLGTIWFVSFMFLVPFGMDGATMAGTIFSEKSADTFVTISSRLLIAFVFLPIFVRMVLVFPSIALGRGVEIPEVWQASKGKALWVSLFFVIGATWLIGMILPDTFAMILRHILDGEPLLFAKAFARSLGEFIGLVLVMTVVGTYYKAIQHRLP